jgi:hypothetical protein
MGLRDQIQMGRAWQQVPLSAELSFLLLFGCCCCYYYYFETSSHCAVKAGSEFSMAGLELQVLCSRLLGARIAGVALYLARFHFVLSTSNNIISFGEEIYCFHLYVFVNHRVLGTVDR